MRSTIHEVVVRPPPRRPLPTSSWLPYAAAHSICLCQVAHIFVRALALEPSTPLNAYKVQTPCDAASPVADLDGAVHNLRDTFLFLRRSHSQLSLVFAAMISGGRLGEFWEVVGNLLQQHRHSLSTSPKNELAFGP